MTLLKRIYTIGHSTRSIEEFASLLAEHRITRLADVRRIPASRRYPHFNGASLRQALAQHAITYEHFEPLGGHREPCASSENDFWSEQLRGYADHMSTPEFRAAVDRLLQDERTTAVMCAEAVPQRCHRNLLSDDLYRRGVEVMHILASGSAQPHALHSHALLKDDRVVYPAQQRSMFP